MFPKHLSWDIHGAVESAVTRPIPDCCAKRFSGQREGADVYLLQQHGARARRASVTSGLPWPALCGLLRERREQFSQREPEAGCQLLKVDQADVTFTALDPADVIPVQVGALGESFLREPEMDAEFSHTCAERHPYISSHTGSIRLGFAGVYTRCV